MWPMVIGIVMLGAAVEGYTHRGAGRREWQILRRNALADKPRRGRWRRAVRMRLLGRK